jgi:inorganic pyrophosphatase
MPNLEALEPRVAAARIRVVVESPRGSTVKLTYEPGIDAFAVTRELPLGLAFPHDFGFVPGTRAEDGDPLDAMVLSEWASCPGAVRTVRIIGAVQLSEAGKGSGKPRIENGRLIVVPEDEPRYAALRESRDLSVRSRNELVRFFLSIVSYAKKDVRFERWIGARAATQVFARCERARAK